MTFKKLPIALASLIICLQVQAAAPIEFLPVQAGDLSARAVIASPDNNAGYAAARPEAVSVSWAAQGEIELKTKPFLAQSRESYRQVSGAQLNAGIDIHTSSARALVRLQPIGEVGQREKDAIHPKELQVKANNGVALSNGDGMEMIVSADKLAKADLPFAPGTSTFRLNSSLGSGTFKLQAGKLQDDQQYLINVVEPDSPFALTMQAESLNYLHGQTLVLHSTLAGLGRAHAMQKIEASLVSPAGRVFPLTFKADANNDYRAQLKLDANEIPTPGAWEVRAQSESQVDGQTVQRTVRIALPVALPVARLSGPAQLQEANGSLALKFGVEAATAGRYEVRGLLYGTVDGKLVALAVAHSAKWLEAGKKSIDLTFDPALLQGSVAPYEVRDVSLLDQGRIGVLHKQARGLVIEATDLQRAGVTLGATQGVVGNGFLNKPVKADSL